jgi:hypothetical protein
VGDVVNLVSVDVQRLAESVLYLNGLWLPLLWIVVCFVYLWQVQGTGRRGGESQSSSPSSLSSSLSSSPSSPSCSSSSSNPVAIYVLWADKTGRALDRLVFA